MERGFEVDRHRLADGGHVEGVAQGIAVDPDAPLDGFHVDGGRGDANHGGREVEVLVVESAGVHLGETGGLGDDELRTLERRWKETSSVEDEASFLAEKVRVGSLSREALRQAAHLGYEPARVAAEVSAPEGPPLNPEPWYAATRSVLARRLVHQVRAPLPSPGRVRVDGVEPGTRGEWFPLKYKEKDGASLLRAASLKHGYKHTHMLTSDACLQSVR